MKTDVAKYFLAIVPPEPVYTQVWKIKEYFRDKYDCKAPLRSPPHITLHMPFAWKMQKEDRLIELLSKTMVDQKAFEVVVEGFGAFPPRVIYIKIKENQALMDFQKRLTIWTRRTFHLFNDTYKERPYHPHMTVAFRDLSKPLFFEAWEEFREKPFVGSFIMDHFCLLKHNGKRWQVYHRVFGK